MTSENRWIEFCSACRTLTALVIVALLMPAGCDIPQRPPIGPAKAATKRPAQNSTDEQAETVEPPGITFSGRWEAWDAYYVNDRKVGYSHIVAEELLGQAIQRSADANVQYIVEDQIRLRRGKANFVQHLRQRSTETRKGELLDFDSTLYVGPTVRSFVGVVDSNQLEIETIEGTARSKRAIEWQSTYRGLVSVQQSLRRKPMKQGEQRRLQGLSPIQYQLAMVTLYCNGPAAIPLLDGRFLQANEIVARYEVSADVVVEQMIWVDDKGAIIKTLRSGDGLTSYRTDEETALAKATAQGDLIAATTIDVSGSIDKPLEAMRVAYVVRPTSDAVRQQQTIQLPAAPDQYVKELADGGFQVFVSRDSKAPSGFQSPELGPEPGDSSPSPLIDFGYRQVGNYAKTIGESDQRTPRELALDLTELTKTLMTHKDAIGFVKASQVSDSLQGGSIEYAVLLAAFLRARKIPARLAIGVVYQPSDKPRMAFHVWNLAHVDGKWISLDAMLGTVAPADRLTLLTTNLSSGKEYDTLKPMLQSLGQIEIEIRGAEH